MRPRSDTLLIWTGAPCTYGCGACPIDPSVAAAGLQLPDLQQGLAAVPDRDGRLAVLLGGEPFLRPDFLRLLAALRVAGCATGVITTGRPLVYPQLRDRLRRFGLAYLRVQLFGVGVVHDRSTAVPGAFEQALAGLRAWVAETGTPCDVDVALSTRGRPVEMLVPEIKMLAEELPAANLQIVIGIDPAVGTDGPETESLRRIVTSFADWNDNPARPLLVWEGLPTAAASASTLTIAPLRMAFVGGAPRACCLGVVGDIVRSRAARRADVHANSFNFVRTETTVAWTADADTCTAHTASAAADLDRQLWLVDADQLVLHVTDTADFDRAAVARVKDVWSHVFVDRAPPGVLDDFTEGMRRVLPDPTCAACAHRTHCGRRFQIVEGPPYAREEAWIVDHISGLRGRVLDVGCGEQLYRAEIATLIGSGAIHYTGLDPDQISLTHARAALAGGRFQLGSIEDFRGDAASYDHILCLRSLNHVDDVDEALARMAALLKPGGSLLIVECTPFAMLRQAEQVAAADRAPRAGHQHLRNLASTEVLPYARRRSLRVIEHRPASLQTTNEWILLLERTPSPLVETA